MINVSIFAAASAETDPFLRAFRRDSPLVSD